MCFPNSKSTFLCLPAEIRFMIYREIWTLEADVDSDTDSDSDSNALHQAHQQLEMITAFQNLAITCRQIREELITEYFTRVLPKTQLHLGSVYPPRHSLYRGRGPACPPPEFSPLAHTNHKSFEVLQSSSLFIEHTQHVSIHWGGCLCTEGSMYQCPIRPRGLEWLAELEDLRTVEVVFTDEPSSCKNCLAKLLMLPRTLEKIVFRVFISDVVAEAYEARLTEWFWGQRPEFLAYMAAMEEDEEVIPERKVEESGLYKIEHHIGAVVVEWPLLDTV
ncbi:hypothetical protein NEUTE1DRAFT_109759 [Neurospora tetrasperma FGSC 2508]|uniref:Uncharacterized protein n=1 Tax=Neurospora tetrasperma (strain FGSC 2508 / ATCC MYA-4615 / P0657) TaxID=510951 RepID=F8ML49_NEUT8|nr:uncharacterized protein NEUTE1DRAFT_109759 [Neurospora tetrasperma FGSC 2508]EGO57524.1 hypothetical protein NEUTE1DRAFT_109759 [Neurospora tetrasperma FGSC 2508]EGZ72216.1 hypothetical protein NEUTE2DRAFT_64390 [Neurospora tetrasperma FGSC 2509]